MVMLKASRLAKVLDRARNAGQVEETATIAGVALVLSSLPSEAYNAILRELEDVPETSYAVCYQIEHVCRSLVEVDGESLRDVDFIEIEGPEPDAPAVRVEKHQWLRDNLVSTWSREMVQTAFRKVLDAIQGADEKASAGVKFRVEAETDEEKYRRLLGELKEVGTELPSDMREAILKEEGLAPATSRVELQALDERVKAWSRDATAGEPPPEVPVQAVVTPPPSPEPPRAPQQLVQAAVSETPAPPSLNRIPMNQTPIRDPVPSAPADMSPTTANWRQSAPPPDQVHTLSRSDRVAALEALDDAPVILQRESRVDPDGAAEIMDRPPNVGLNPKYVPPQGRAGGLNPRARAR